MRLNRSVLALTALALVLAACGGADDSAETTAAGEVSETTAAGETTETTAAVRLRRVKRQASSTSPPTRSV
jgi:ABC-type glycerol-3-phosphate transport system substrate-binding protein